MSQRSEDFHTFPGSRSASSDWFYSHPLVAPPLRHGTLAGTRDDEKQKDAGGLDLAATTPAPTPEMDGPTSLVLNLM